MSYSRLVFLLTVAAVVLTVGAAGFLLWIYSTQGPGAAEQFWGYLAIALGWALRELIPRLSKALHFIRAGEMRDGYSAIAETYRVLETSRAEAHASRAHIFVSKNGGGVPKPGGGSVEVSLRYESVRDGVRRIADDFQNWVVDKQYAVQLSDVANAPTGVAVSKAVSDLENGVFQTMLVSDNIVRTHDLRLCMLPSINAMLYVSYSFEKGHENLSPSQIEAMRAGAAKLTKIVSRWNEVVA